MKNILLAIFLVIIVGVIGFIVYDAAKSGNSETDARPQAQAVEGITADNSLAKIQEIDITKNKYMVTLKTNYGDIQIMTYDKDAPKTVNNFLILAEKGFYNGLTFHRVIKGFMIQGGDPNCSKTETASLCGSGGPGYKFLDELNPATESYKTGYGKGVVAMANSGPNTNGSQFFIMLDYNNLKHDYTIFGKVVGGQDVVDKIGNVETSSNDRPLSPVIIESAVVKPI
ncbi:MAG: peptidylprolyl isomerase [Candidatus Wolfebacteria bacterium]|nr:peptidylprolyl isomerase [Candidatus Wolfebacteria bacterium]